MLKNILQLISTGIVRERRGKVLSLQNQNQNEQVMKTSMNVNISLPQSEFVILKKMAKALGWNLFVEQETNTTDIAKRKEMVEKLYGCIQLPDDFDYKKEMEKAMTEKYKL